MSWSALSVWGHPVANSDTDAFTLPPRTVLNLSASLTTSAPLRPAKMAMHRVRSRNQGSGYCRCRTATFGGIPPILSFCENGSERLERRGTNGTTAPFVLAVVVLVTIQVAGVLLGSRPAELTKIRTAPGLGKDHSHSIRGWSAHQKDAVLRAMARLGGHNSGHSVDSLSLEKSSAVLLTA